MIFCASPLTLVLADLPLTLFSSAFCPSSISAPQTQRPGCWAQLRAAGGARTGPGQARPPSRRPLQPRCPCMGTNARTCSKYSFCRVLCIPQHFMAIFMLLLQTDVNCFCTPSCTDANSSLCQLRQLADATTSWPHVPHSTEQVFLPI